MSRVPALALALLCTLLTLLGCSGAETEGARDDDSPLGAAQQALQSTVHQLQYNTSSTLALKPGDVLRLQGFPGDWAYTSVELNFDATSVPLSFVVSENTNQYTLGGWNKKIVVPYRRTATQDLVVTAGTGNARIVWWVSNGSKTPADAPQEPEQPTEGPKLRDLGGMNSATVVDGSSGLFTIKGYPSWTYNVVSLMIEPRDGKQLAGELHSGGVQTTLSGWSQKVMFKEHGSAEIAFELLFRESRQVALTWFVENRVPASKAIGRTLSGSGSSVTAKYGFAAEHAVQNDLSLIFNPADFSDGQLPTMTRLEHNPQGVRSPDAPDDLHGPSYDIHAKLKPGKRVQVALPVPEIALIRGIDETAITIMHYDAASKAWTEILPDKVSDGYVYFTTDSFSTFLSRMKKRAKKAAAVVVAVIAAPVVVATTAVAIVVDTLADVTKAAYKALVSAYCATLDFDTYKNLFFDKPSSSAAKPNLDALRKLPEFSSVALRSTRGALTPLSQASDEVGKLHVSVLNARMLLADVLQSDVGWRRYQLRGRLDSAVIVDTETSTTHKVRDVLQFTSRVFGAAPRVLSLIQECDHALGPGDEFAHTVDRVTGLARAVGKVDLGDTCREALMLPLDLIDWAVPADGLSCLSEAATFGLYYLQKNLGQVIPQRDAHIIAASEVLSALSAAAWIDPSLRAVLASGIEHLRDGIHGYVGLTHEAYGDNNIPIKAMASVAMWDMITRADKGAYNTMRRWLEAKSGDYGGYAEGTGYLQYVNADVPYLMSAMLRGGFITSAELPQKYLKSGEWLLNQSRYLGGGGNTWQFLPVEIDDGKPAAIDFFVYSYLTGDGRYRSFATSQRDFRHIPAPFGYLGLPDPNLPVSAPISKNTLPDVYFADGVGVVRARSGGQMATLAVVAESDRMLSEGYAHDQQDNGSVTLTHSHYWNIIEDTGYNGFSERAKTAYFDKHNVVRLPVGEGEHGGEASNGLIRFRDVTRIVSHLPDVHNLAYTLDWAPDVAAFNDVGLQLFSFTTGVDFELGLTFAGLRVDWGSINNMPVGKEEGFAGGSPAGLIAPLVSDVPLHASHGLEVLHTSTAGVTNRRFLLSYADNVWVIDRALNHAVLASQMHFNRNAVPSTVQFPPATVAEDITQDQHGHPTLSLTRLTSSAGSMAQPPVFVTARRTSSAIPPNITELGCVGAVCLRSNDFAGNQDLVIIPRWGQEFIDDGLFQNRVRTGQIVLAHRDSAGWSLRLVGDLDPELASTSLSARTGHAPGVVYRLADTGAFAAHYPNGVVQPLP